MQMFPTPMHSEKEKEKFTPRLIIDALTMAIAF